MKKFITLVFLLAIALGTGWLVWQHQGRKRPAEPRAIPNLPKPKREFRFALLGRPGELPLHALPRMPELQDLPIRFVTCSTPAERWLLLASGQVDALLASSDELALALPGYSGRLGLFAVARHQGNEQMIFAKEGAANPPLIAYLPGGVGQGLALALKDPQLQTVAAATPESALQMLKAGQVRGSSLWGEQLEQARALGFVSRNRSSGLEVWVSSQAGAETGRLSGEDSLKVAHAWLDLMGQLKQQSALTLRAIAEESEQPAARVSASLQGLEFFDAEQLQRQKSQLTAELSTELRDKANLWSLAGRPVSGDIGRLKVESDWLESILEGTPTVVTETPEIAPESASPSPTPLVTPGSATPGAAADPFDHPGTAVRPAGQSQAGGDPQHSGRLPGPALEREPTQLWATPLGSEVTTAAVASPDGTQIFAGCADGNLVCLEAGSGRALWKYSLGERIRSAPAVAEGQVLAASDSGRIVSLDSASGEVRWTAQASSDVVGPLCLAADSLLATTLDGNVLCLGAGDGEERWRQATGGNLTAGVAVSDGLVIVGGVSQKVQAFQLEGGAPAWTQRLGGACRATPCIDSGLVMLGCSDQQVYALRVKDGTQAWKQKLPDEVSCSPLSLGRNLYLGCKDNAVHCLDRGTGKELWKYPTRERITTDVVGAGGTVYVCSQDMRLYALQGGPGPKLLFKFKQNSWLQTPWVQGGVVYLPTSEGNLIALK